MRTGNEYDKGGGEEDGNGLAPDVGVVNLPTIPIPTAVRLRRDMCIKYLRWLGSTIMMTGVPNR